MAPGEGSVVLVWDLPRPWPPQRPSQVVSQNVNGSILTISVDERGRLGVSVKGSNDQEQTRLFQPMKTDGPTRVALIVKWSVSTSMVQLAVNGNDLALDAGADTPSFTIPTSLSGSPRALIFPALDPSRYPNQTERLLAEKVHDLDQSIVSGKSYDLLRTSALLRHLLVDGGSLVDQVNRAYKLKLTFTIIDPNPEPPGQPTHHWRNPEPVSGAKTVVVNLKQLLATQCLFVQSQVGTVRDVIKTAANAKGGVHSGQADSTAQKTILDWDEAVRLLGEEPSLRALAGISSVVLRGLMPLVVALQPAPSQA